MLHLRKRENGEGERRGDLVREGIEGRHCEGIQLTDEKMGERNWGKERRGRGKGQAGRIGNVRGEAEQKY